MGFLDSEFESHIHHNVSFQTFPMSNLTNTLSGTSRILTGPPVYPADLLSRRFRGVECDMAWFC